MSTPEVYSYLAGIIDGEGYIGIKKAAPRIDCVNPCYHERVQVRMVRIDALQLLHDVFGGSLYKEQPHANNGRPLYCWQISDKKASTALTVLLPYLRVKRRVAQIVLRLRRVKDTAAPRRRKRPLNAREMDMRERIYLAVKKEIARR